MLHPEAIELGWVVRMAKEYIEREELYKQISSAYIAAERCGFELGKDVVLLAIKQQPAADVVEVRHGRWREAMGDSGVVRMACTNCSFYRFPENDVREQMFNYCPRCGAIMDGGQDDG